MSNEINKTQTGHKKRAFDGRTYLVLFDEGDCFEKALCYAARLAKHNQGHIAIVYLYENRAGPSAWGNVEDIMRQESREAAEKEAWNVVRDIQERYEITPCLFLEEGGINDVLARITNKACGVDTLILSSETDRDGHHTALNYFSSKGVNKLDVPMVIVPGHLSIDEIMCL